MNSLNDLSNLPEYLTYDDVLLLPGFADFSRGDITLATKLSRRIELKIPLVAAPMDTVSEHKLAIALGKMGGIAIIHRNLSVQDQALEVKKVKAEKLLVGAAVGAGKGFEERALSLVEAGADCVVVDSAHGYATGIITAIGYIKKNFPQVDVIGGNVATYDGAAALIQAGADGLRVGMGPGAICTTRIISGMGVPQLTAVAETCRAAKGEVPVIADGGIKYSGDMMKALAAGAATVMMGSMFAAADEAPGEMVMLTAEELPAKFRHIVKPSVREYVFKQYRGMGSIGAMEKGAEIKSEDEFHGKDYYKERVMVAEGVEGLVPAKGSVEEIVNQVVGGMRSGMYYLGVTSIPQLQEKAKFIKITQASLTESHPHDIVVVNPGKNYQ